MKNVIRKNLRKTTQNFKHVLRVHGKVVLVVVMAAMLTGINTEAEAAPPRQPMMLPLPPKAVPQKKANESLWEYWYHYIFG